MKKEYFVALDKNGEYYYISRDSDLTFISALEDLEDATRYEFIDDIYHDKTYYSESQVDVYGEEFNPVRIQKITVAIEIVDDVDFENNKYLDEV